MKDDFPIFKNNLGLVYLDSAATAQKPQHVIDRVSEYLAHDYANIHRGYYSLSQRSEDLYREARKKVAECINAHDDEVIFTSSSTDSVNLLVRSLIRSNYIGPDDVIMLTELEHHANLVPRQMLAEHTGATLVWIPVGSDGMLDTDLVLSLLDTHPTTKILALTLCSNVTGNDWSQEVRGICKYLALKYQALEPQILKAPHFSVGNTNRIRPLIVADASQYIAHRRLDVTALGIDVCFFTGHKLGAHTGIGVLRARAEFLKLLTPGKVGGGAVEQVGKDRTTYIGAPDAFEPGTPNLVGAISLLGALEYIQSLDESGAGDRDAAYSRMRQHENTLITYALEQFQVLERDGILTLLGSHQAEQKQGLFSFVLHTDVGSMSSSTLGQHMATKDICIRCGAQCSHIYHTGLIDDPTCGKAGECIVKSCRISFWIYTSISDLKAFFEELGNMHLIHSD